MKDWAGQAAGGRIEADVQDGLAAGVGDAGEEVRPADGLVGVVEVGRR